MMVLRFTELVVVLLLLFDDANERDRVGADVEAVNGADDDVVDEADELDIEDDDESDDVEQVELVDEADDDEVLKSRHWLIQEASAACGSAWIWLWW